MIVPNRDALERELARALAGINADALRAVTDALGDPPSLSNVPDSVWRQYGDRLREELRAKLEAIYTEQARALADDLGKTPGAAVDWSLVNERARDWAASYSFELVRGVVDTTTGGVNDALQRALQDAISRGVGEHLTRGEISDALMPLFGPTRAEMIAITEVTRASAQGEAGLVEELKGAGFDLIAVWNTSADDAVCPVCGEYDGTEQGDGWDELPPAHPGCRCFITHHIKGGNND